MDGFQNWWNVLSFIADAARLNEDPSSVVEDLEIPMNKEDTGELEKSEESDAKVRFMKVLKVKITSIAKEEIYS